MKSFAENCVGAGTRARPWGRPLSVALGLLALLGSCTRPAFATDKYWTGATSTAWGTNGNWTGNAPSAGDNGVFNGTFTNQPNVSGNTSAGGIWMATGVGQNVTVSGAGVLQLSGGTINGTVGLGILMDNTSGYTLTIDTALKLGGNQTWRNNSGNLLTIGAGGVDLNNKTFTIDGTGNTAVTGVMSNAGAFTKDGTGTLTLSGTNTYTGTTDVVAGILNIQNAAALGATGSGTTVSSGATLQLQGTITVGAETLNINGAGASGQTGALVNVSGTNNYGGLLTLAGATTISSDSGTLNLTNAGTITGATFGTTLAGAGDGTVSSIIGTTSGGLNKTGAGTWTLSGVNTYTGVTTISGGTLSVGTIGNGGVAGNLGAASNAAANLVLNGGTLQYTGAAASTDRLFTLDTGGGTIDSSGSGTATFSNTGSMGLTGSGARTLTLTGSNNGSLAAVVGDSGGATALTKTGGGTWTLTGANTFTGNTTVSAGTLAVNADNALGATAKVTINTGGTVLLGTTAGNNRIGNTTEVALAGGIFNTGGFSETVGKMTLSGNSTLDFGAGTSHLTFDGASSLGSSTLTVLNWTGVPVTVGGTDQLLFTNSSFTAGSTTSQVQFNIGGTLYNSIFLNAGSSILELVPVPEPSTIFGACIFAIAVGWRERRRLARLFRKA